jgi:hypothetical protein
MPYLSSRRPSEPVEPLPAGRRYRGHSITIIALVFIISAAYFGSSLIT